MFPSALPLPGPPIVTLNKRVPSLKHVKLIAAAQESFSVPFIAGDSPKASAKSVTKNVILPKSAKGKIICGKQYGTIQYKIGETVLNNVPLIADRDSEECWFGKRIADKIAELIF